MNRYMILTSVICLLLGALPGTGNAQLVFVDSATTVVCSDSIFWVDVQVDSMVKFIHSYQCLMYIDTSKVHLDSVIRGTILNGHSFDFGWEYNRPGYPDSLFFGASIFGAGDFVNGPGQLARIWLSTKREGDTPVAFGRCVLLDTSSQAEPMEVTTEDGQIIVLGPGYPIGDANDDDVVDLGDILYLISYLYKGGPEPLPLWIVGDVNCDILVDLGDLLYLINYLYKDGLKPCDPCEEE